MSWLRRNRWALLALVILVPAAVAAAMSISLFRYYADLQHDPVVVPEGETGEFVPTRPGAGDELPVPVGEPAEFTMDSYVVVPWDTDVGREVGLLEGSEAVSVLIEVDATGMPEGTFSCSAILVAPGPQGERVWPMASGSDLDYYPSGDIEANCSLSQGSAFTWEAVFVVPEGVGEDAELYISYGALQPRRVLQLEH